MVRKIALTAALALVALFLVLGIACLTSVVPTWLAGPVFGLGLVAGWCLGNGIVEVWRPDVI